MGSAAKSQVTIGLVDQPAWVGGQLYIENLARSLLLLPQEERPLVVWFGPGRELDPALSSLPRVVAPAPMGRVGYATFIALQARKRHCSFVYPFPLRIPGVKSAYWLPDLQHAHLPQLFSKWNRIQRDIAYRVFASISPTIVVSSRAVQSDLASFFPPSEAKTRILHFHTPLEPGDLDSQSAAAIELLNKLPDRYIYVPNQMWQHKDHPTVLRALAHIRREHGLNIPLLLSGSRGDYRNPGWATQVDQLIDELAVRDLVSYLGHLPRKIQLSVMHRASIVVQPSLFEGWSTVVEDARALGRPMLLSDIAPNVEQAPELGAYFRAGDASDLAHRLLEMWTCSESPSSLDELFSRARQRCLVEARTFMQIAVGNYSE